MEITILLNNILINHKKWLNDDTEGVRADLRWVDFSGADLSKVNLSDADLRFANLAKANLCEADLYHADLSNANLSNANLSGADLSGAYLRFTSLLRADLSKANLFGADLSGAELSRADLNITAPSKIDLRRSFPLVCPETGEFIGWKKAAHRKIVKIKVTETAKRSSAFGRKCRCSEAVVLAIENIDGTAAFEQMVFSMFDLEFGYKIGETVSVPNFDDDWTHECAPGIHFFMTRKEAVDYVF